MDIRTRFCGLLLGLTCLLFGCQQTEKTSAPPSPTALEDVPAWAQDVVWYQIMVERFRNGDPANDPTPEDIKGSYPGFIPDSWAVTPWTHDWYAPDPYFAELEGIKDFSGNPVSNFGQKAQLRRYGGDLQGVMDKLPYLDSLGVTAIFFNPINDAPSLHKYDARYWRHVDRNFGPTPRKDAETMANEHPTDPSTWKMTGADSLFVELVAEIHSRGMKVIMDYSWNHTGITHWAAQDVLQKGKTSAYADWYDVDEWDDPETPENETKIHGWVGVPDLPEIRETQPYHGGAVKAYEGELYSEAVLQHIYHISQRWLDPNGDGDPSDGVDGFRLDVAGELPLGFWRKFRKHVRDINPEVYLVGEIWWEEWPDKLLDPAPFLAGDVFDAVMNYRWYRASREYLAAAPERVPVSKWVDSLNAFSADISAQHSYGLMNLISSHDVPRASTSIYNRNKYKVDTNPYAGNPYMIDQPNAETFQTMRMLIAHQFTYVGAPHIWMGDEMGMWGSDDPNCRKPLIWPDYEFEAERAHPLGLKRKVDEVRFNTGLFEYYQSLAALRNRLPVLRRGQLEFVQVDDEKDLLAYRRFDEESEVFVVINGSETAQSVSLSATPKQGYYDFFSGSILQSGETLDIQVQARSVAILIRE